MTAKDRAKAEARKQGAGSMSESAREHLSWVLQRELPVWKPAADRIVEAITAVVDEELNRRQIGQQATEIAERIEREK